MHDPLWMHGTLAAHIAAGATAFVMAPAALATAKGGRAHRRWGKVYFWAMAVVAATAMVMSLYRPTLFLALVAIFSFYGAFSAYRVLSLKDMARGGRPAPVDWAAAVFTFLSSFVLACLGAFRPALVQGMGAVSIVFGIVGMAIAFRSLSDFLRPPTDKMFWWYRHLGGMMGSYIAAWTAFSAVTLSRFIGVRWLVWLWPTIIGVPAITLTTIYYRRKFATRPTTPA